MPRVLKAEVDSAGKVNFPPAPGIGFKYRCRFRGLSISQGLSLSSDAFTVAEKAEVPIPALDAHLAALQERLQQLRQLPANWDLHGAQAIDPSVLTYAMTFLTNLIDPGMPLPQIVPRVRGSLQLEWHTSNKDLEVYLDAPEQGTFLFEDVDQAEELEGNIRTHLAELKKILQELDA